MELFATESCWSCHHSIIGASPLVKIMAQVVHHQQDVRSDVHSEMMHPSWMIPQADCVCSLAMTTPLVQVPTEPYRLQPLSGLVISATNFGSKGDRELLQQQIEAAGGTYSAEMHKGVCSHLVCKFAKGEKYRSAGAR
jgi:hypothetical protein